MDQSPNRNQKDENFLKGFVVSSGMVLSAVAVYIFANMITLLAS